MYKQLPDRLNYAELEENILRIWNEEKIFERSVEQRTDAPVFSFFEGPPTVNGKPGLHHLMARTVKDMICRYKAMCGYYVRRQAGWDTHGLPVEIAVQQQMKLTHKSDIERIGVERFNAACKDFVYKNIKMDGGWREFTTRMGYWVDLDSAYITCSNDYVESVWWALKQFFDKGLIYKGFKVVPQSPTIETPLSSHELSLGYRDVRDPNCYLKLRIISSPVPDIDDAAILVWTTTPWTLFANTALAVGADVEYALVNNTRIIDGASISEKFVIANARISALDGETEIIKTFSGNAIIGSVYEKIFEYCPIDRKKYPNALTVLAGDFVTTSDGTGIVHIAPAFGVDDLEMSKRYNLPFLQPVTPNGHFTEDVGEFAGRAIKNFTYSDHTEDGADRDIVKALKKSGKIYRATFDYLHSYPHCWRTENPVMYYARESWFIRSPEYKSAMIDLNAEINWQPPEIGKGRFGNWLEEVKDWSLSRDRFWGTPLPIWVADGDDDMFVVGSIAELCEGLYEVREGVTVPVKESGVEIDLHRPFADRVIFRRNGKTYRRVPEVIDVWFDSGAVPFAQFHYPFENKDVFEQNFPADFIAEGIDQTRGWFYTLHNIASAVFGKPAFKSIIVNDLILDEKGRKMSKSKGNTIDPFEIMARRGADAVRWYMIVNNPPWRPTLFNEQDLVKTVVSDFFRYFTESYKFYALYANIDDITGNEQPVPIDERPEIDRWILSALNSTLARYREAMDSLDIHRAARIVQDFLRNDVSNWYVRRNRRRFWKGERDAEKIAAYQTLRETLMTIAAMVAPAAPFLSDYLYRSLRATGQPVSVHLSDMPKPDATLINEDLERRMSLAQKVVFLARSLRERAKIRTRQPLRRILLPISSSQQRRDFQAIEDIILDEINIKYIEYVKDDAGIVRRSARPNFKNIGKKFGKSTQAAAQAIREMSDDNIRRLQQTGECSLLAAGEPIVVSAEDVEIVSADVEGWLVTTDGTLTVALDTEIDEELIAEGLAREFVNRAQNVRKDAGLNVTDRIRMTICAPVHICRSIETMRGYVMNETLATELNFSDKELGQGVEIYEQTAFIVVEKV
ncbi:isoleucine--tRNA ligase [Ignavibacteria bacterium]|nr:isoleucine--tRNA ligase [Bacteroidota bacterium]MCZ2131919.1 isoleucine--tRNA ligase [Bacteroidota bacterium]